MQATEAIAHVLAPTGLDEFWADYFERRPLWVSRHDPHHYDRWLTLEAFQGVLTGVDAEILKLKCAKDDVVETGVGLQRAMDAFRGGSTIVVNHIHLVHAPVAVLCRALEGFFYHSFQANTYYTPGSNRGFGAHFDLHDVFILQIHGRKRWRVYAPEVELPLAEQQKPVQLDPRATPVLEATLTAGDALYIPRGFIHEAAAAHGGATLHLSLGMIPLTWRDLLQMATQDAAMQNAGLRGAVPLSPLGPSPRGLEEALAAVASELRERSLRMARERFVMTRTAVQPEFGLSQTPLKATSRLRRNPLVLHAMSSNGQSVAVSFQGKGLEFPAEAADALAFVLGSDHDFTVGDVPSSLDEVNKLRLLQYLRDEGLLTCLK